MQPNYDDDCDGFIEPDRIFSGAKNACYLDSDGNLECWGTAQTGINIVPSFSFKDVEPTRTLATHFSEWWAYWAPSATQFLGSWTYGEPFAIIL